jgi:hypothetical protein
VQASTDSPVVRSGSAPARLAIILATTLAGAAWLAHKGPVPVIRITTPLSETAPFWYMLLAFPVLGMLVADLFDLWRVRGLSLPTVELGLQIALIVALSSLRIGVREQVSGDCLGPCRGNPCGCPSGSGFGSPHGCRIRKGRHKTCPYRSHEFRCPFKRQDGRSPAQVR